LTIPRALVPLLLLPALAAAAPLEVEIRGNEVLLDPVLLREMKLPKKGPATPKLAERVEERLRAFFRDTGYGLARVEAYEFEGRLEVLIEEGRLDKIVFLGTGDWKTLNLRLEFDLPGRVYNSHQVKAELDRLKKKYGFKALRAEVIEVRSPRRAPFQLERLIKSRRLKAAEDFWLRQRGRYELRIETRSEAWGAGLGYGLYYRDPEGMTAFLQYEDSGLLLARDRHRTRIAASAWTRSSLLSGENDFTLTQGTLGFRWYTPALIGEWFRPNIDLRADVLNLQRGDLGVDSYWRFVLAAALNLGFEPHPQVSFSVGAGYAFEALVDLETAADATVPDEYDPRQLPFVQAGIRLLLEPPQLRTDKRHELSLSYRDFNYWQENHVDSVGLRYHKCFAFGYEELILRARGFIVWGGEVLWTDERSLTSDTMRAVAGELKYARKTAQTGLEFRFSLHRDLVKVGLFAEVGIFGEIQRPDPPAAPTDPPLTARSPRDEKPAYLFAFGPGAHLLILDSFQIDVYYGFGFYLQPDPEPNDDGWDYDGRVTFSLTKVY